MDRVGNGGGLILLWSDSVSMTIRSFSVEHINTVLFDRSRS